MSGGKPGVVADNLAVARWLFLAVLLLPTLPSAAVARPVVVELFTSEACSSCPPADLLLGRLKTEQKDLLALDLHVTYWNGSGWTDPYSLGAATERQEWYTDLKHSNELYTPEAVVDGETDLVGSDRAAILEAIARARHNANEDAVPLRITLDSGTVRVAVGRGSGPARLWLFGYDDTHTTHIGGGENTGATLTEVNVVRSITPVGMWRGDARSFALARPKGAHLALVLQRDDGSIIGAARD
ncbi:MAG: DUF1223 domain-containing protein [Acetobacteraceae bacterium]